MKNQVFTIKFKMSEITKGQIIIKNTLLNILFIYFIYLDAIKTKKYNYSKLRSIGLVKNKLDIV